MKGTLRGHCLAECVDGCIIKLQKGFKSKYSPNLQKGKQKIGRKLLPSNTNMHKLQSNGTYHLYFDLNKILTAPQHGFCNGFSCEIQLLVTAWPCKYQDSKIQTYIDILDLLKSFRRSTS